MRRVLLKLWWLPACLCAWQCVNTDDPSTWGLNTQTSELLDRLVDILEALSV